MPREKYVIIVTHVKYSHRYTKQRGSNKVRRLPEQNTSKVYDAATAGTLKRLHFLFLTRLNYHIVSYAVHKQRRNDVQKYVQIDAITGRYSRTEILLSCLWTASLSFFNNKHSKTL